MSFFYVGVIKFLTFDLNIERESQSYFRSPLYSYRGLMKKTIKMPLVKMIIKITKRTYIHIFCNAFKILRLIYILPSNV